MAIEPLAQVLASVVAAQLLDEQAARERKNDNIEKAKMTIAVSQNFTVARHDAMTIRAAPLSRMDAYFAVWAFVMPWTTFLMIPQIQGTTPAYILALLSLGVCGVSKRYLQSGLIIGAVFLTFFVLSQVGLLANGVVSLKELNLIEPRPRSPVFRRTTVTQGLYFLASLATFLFVRVHFRRRWMPYIFAGAWLLVVYGLYEWTFFFIFKHTGDFLGNRVFESGGETHTGSWSQTIVVGSMTLLRVKSVTGEPSFFAAVAVPYLALAATSKRYLLACGLTLTMLLSFSTSAYFGIVFVLGYIAYARGYLDLRIIAVSCVAIVVLIALAMVFPKTFASMFMEKLTGHLQSGEERWFDMTYPFRYFAQLPLINKLFGIGFGTTYLSGTVRVLIDVGLFGLALYILFFVWPLFRLPSKQSLIGIKAAVAALLFLYTVATSEIFYPTTWMMLGLAYWELDQASPEAGPGSRHHGAEFSPSGDEPRSD